MAGRVSVSSIECCYERNREREVRGLKAFVRRSQLDSHCHLFSIEGEEPLRRGPNDPSDVRPSELACKADGAYAHRGHWPQKGRSQDERKERDADLKVRTEPHALPFGDQRDYGKRQCWCPLGDSKPCRQ